MFQVWQKKNILIMTKYGAINRELQQQLPRLLNDSLFPLIGKIFYDLLLMHSNELIE